ncbi:MAG TPA: AMP-binding protein [Planctomycetota bacterium]|nr:AMP-binding protein [Planctomycetota bacterium]
MNSLLKELGTTGLGGAFLLSACRTPDRIAVLDSKGARVAYRDLSTRALALAAVLERKFGKDEAPRVGVCLPPGALGALVNVALALGGRASVNLNAVAGPAALREQVEHAGLSSVILARSATALAPLLGERALFVEDLEDEVSASDLDRAAEVAQLPREELQQLCDDLRDERRIATVLFSSGSTSRPKAIQLSHASVLANARAVASAFDLAPDDRVLGVLPFFHSFGYTVTLWAPLVAGASVVFHDNPLDARGVGELAAAERPTVMLATPALCQAWMRRIEPEQLASVRLTIVGAQRLQPTLASAWRERFGTLLYEGYGCTELAPVVAANLPDVDGRVRRRAGSVGRPIPGVELEIRDPQTGERLPADAEGDLWVHSPGLMQGYLGDEAATRRAIVDGWYDTQDVARVDRDGFLTLTDRRSRFSKIGGEMVSHGAVECALTAAAIALGEPATLGLAVTALDDEQRGERLVVLHTPLLHGIESLLERARKDGLSNLFTPRAADAFEVEALPQLATGKIDLGKLKKLAAESRRSQTAEHGRARA